MLLSSPASSFVVKISLSSLIDRERRMHSLVDGSSPHLRKMVAGTGSHGVVKGVGDGLAFLLLDGVGDPFMATHVSSDVALASLWQQASDGLDALHKKRVLHRDVKAAPPSSIASPVHVVWLCRIVSRTSSNATTTTMPMQLRVWWRAQ